MIVMMTSNHWGSDASIESTVVVPAIGSSKVLSPATRQQVDIETHSHNWTAWNCNRNHTAKPVLMCTL